MSPSSPAFSPPRFLRPWASRGSRRRAPTKKQPILPKRPSPRPKTGPPRRARPYRRGPALRWASKRRGSVCGRPCSRREDLTAEPSPRTIPAPGRTNPAVPVQKRPSTAPDQDRQEAPDSQGPKAQAAPTGARPGEDARLTTSASLNLIDAATDDLAATIDIQERALAQAPAWWDELAVIHYDRLAGPIAAAFAVSGVKTFVARVGSGPRFDRSSREEVRHGSRV